MLSVDIKKWLTTTDCQGSNEENRSGAQWSPRKREARSKTKEEISFLLRKCLRRDAKCSAQGDMLMRRGCYVIQITIMPTIVHYLVLNIL